MGPRAFAFVLVAWSAVAFECGSRSVRSESGASSGDAGDAAQDAAAIRNASAPADAAAAWGLDQAACVDASVTTECDAPYLCAAEYDQSCQTDSDCVLITEGQFCAPLPGCGGAGPLGAVSLAGDMQYVKDLEQTPGWRHMGKGGACLPPPAQARCRDGQCRVEEPEAGEAMPLAVSSLSASQLRSAAAAGEAGIDNGGAEAGNPTTDAASVDAGVIACAGRPCGTECCPGERDPSHCANNAGWLCDRFGRCSLPNGMNACP